MNEDISTYQAYSNTWTYGPNTLPMHVNILNAIASVRWALSMIQNHARNYSKSSRVCIDTNTYKSRSVTYVNYVIPQILNTNTRYTVRFIMLIKNRAYLKHTF